MNKHRIYITTLLVGFFLMQGCSSKVGVVSDSAYSGDPVAMAADGAKLNTEGAKLVKKGEDKLKKGRKQLREGEAMLESATSDVSNARIEYRETAGITGDAGTPSDVSAEAKELAAIGKRWKKAIDEIRDGNKLIEKGNDNITAGQSDIRQGRQLMTRGSTLVRNSARSTMDVDLLPKPEFN